MASGAVGQGIGGSSATTPQMASEVTLQQSLEQIESAVHEAHNVLDRISPRQESGGDKPPDAPGAVATGMRTQARLQELISRLNEVANVVGSI